MVGRGHAIADHAQGAHLRADRRHGGRAHHVAPREARWCAQLGLSLLLAARRDAHAARADECRLLRRSAGVARLAPARRRRLALATANHVRPRRRASSLGIRGAVAAGLRAVNARSDRQRRARTAAARRVRRSRRHALSGQARRTGNAARRLEFPAGDSRAPRAGVELSGQGRLGNARRPSALHLFEDHGVGRPRSRHPGDRSEQGRRPGRPVA